MKNFKKQYCRFSLIAAICVLLFTIVYSIASPHIIYAAQAGEGTELTTDANGIHLTVDNKEGSLSASVEILLFLTILSLAPSILIMLTSYTRIIVVLHFVRGAIGTQTAPPNQVLIGLALFLTFFIMWPTIETLNTTVMEPLDRGEITTTEQIVEIAEVPIREFMMKHTQDKDLELFIDISGGTYTAYEEIPLTIYIPAFVISELRTAFIMGFLIYIPFIIIDMVVSSVLMSMGMMMLPPVMISLPFKILLFILVDGWYLVMKSLLQSF